MNAYASYAAEKAPPARQSKDWDNKRANFNGGVKELSPLEKKMREKQRLSKTYMRRRRQETKATLASESRLAGFLRYLRTVQAGTGGELLEALGACEWLLTAPLETRLFALKMIDARCNKINQQLGNDTLDDPLPPDSNIYFQAKALLYAGGRDA